MALPDYFSSWQKSALGVEVLPTVWAIWTHRKVVVTRVVAETAKNFLWCEGAFSCVAALPAVSYLPPAVAWCQPAAFVKFSCEILEEYTVLLFSSCALENSRPDIVRVIFCLLADGQQMSSHSLCLLLWTPVALFTVHNSEWGQLWVGLCHTSFRSDEQSPQGGLFSIWTWLVFLFELNCPQTCLVECAFCFVTCSYCFSSFFPAAAAPITPWSHTYVLQWIHFVTSDIKNVGQGHILREIHCTDIFQQ